MIVLFFATRKLVKRAILDINSFKYEKKTIYLLPDSQSLSLPALLPIPINKIPIMDLYMKSLLVSPL